MAEFFTSRSRHQNISSALSQFIFSRCLKPNSDTRTGTLVLPFSDTVSRMLVTLGVLTARKYFKYLPTPCDKWVAVNMAWSVVSLRMEERPSICRVAANILNKQSRTADKAWSSSLGIGRGANNFSPQKHIMLPTIHKESLGLGLIIWPGSWMWRGMDWIGLSEDRDRWRTLVITVMNLRVLQNAGNFLTSCEPVSLSRRTLLNGVCK